MTEVETTHSFYSCDDDDEESDADPMAEFKDGGGLPAAAVAQGGGGGRGDCGAVAIIAGIAVFSTMYFFSRVADYEIKVIT